MTLQNDPYQDGYLVVSPTETTSPTDWSDFVTSHRVPAVIVVPGIGGARVLVSTSGMVLAPPEGISAAAAMWKVRQLIQPLLKRHKRATVVFPTATQAAIDGLPMAAALAFAHEAARIVPHPFDDPAGLNGFDGDAAA